MSWQVFARRSHAPLSARLLQEAQRAPVFADITQIPFGLRNHLWLADVIYVRAEEIAALDEILERLVSSSDWSFLARFAGSCAEALTHLTATAGQIVLDLRGSPHGTEELINLAGRWFEAYRRACAFIPVFRSIDRLLTRYIPSEELSGFMSSGGHPTEEARERAALRGIVEHLRAIGDHSAAAPEATQLIDDHVEEFGWLGARWYLGSTFCAEDVRRRVVALVARAQSFAAPLRSEERSLDWRRPIVERLAFLRTHRAEVINKAIWIIRPLLTAIGHHLGADYSEVVHLFPDEIVAALRTRAPPLEVARARRLGCGTALLDDEFHLLDGPQAIEAFKRMVNLPGAVSSGLSDAGRTPLLRGVVACPGKARGRARLVWTKDDGAKVLAGDILITVMTYPNLVASMQRAAAIVTDDGGLLSHAAVTARELEKPCLIDTRRATEIFRDGDLVEVDCDAGFIRGVTAPGDEAEQP